MSKQKTMLFVGIAGFLFLLAVILNLKWLFVIGAIFDWLPVFVWMKKEGKPNKFALAAHISLTIVAYGFGIYWFLFDQFKLVFIELWWSAVIAGEFI